MALLSSVAAPALAERPGKPALDTLLRAFAERRDEKAMQEIPSIEWSGVSYPNDSEKDNAYIYMLRGRLRLVGFGPVDVPVGVGAGQTTRKADEGEANFEVRLSSANDPAIRGSFLITMHKLYPTPDHELVLERNLPGARVVLLADACTRDSLGRSYLRARSRLLPDRAVPGTDRGLRPGQIQSRRRQFRARRHHLHLLALHARQGPDHERLHAPHARPLKFPRERSAACRPTRAPGERRAPERRWGRRAAVATRDVTKPARPREADGGER